MIVLVVLVVVRENSEELRRWFLSFESQLFRFRLERLSDEERAQFMRANGLQYELVSAEEKEAKREMLFGLPNVTPLNFSELRFYKVPFTQALDLVANRSVLLSFGYAYVPTAKLVSIIVARFRMNLSKELISAANMFQHVSADPRIGQLLKNMNKQYVGKDYSKADGVDRLTPDKVGQAAELHFPLCMRNLHDALARDHHLKHGGRLQYGLFLKGAGMKLEDALVYWQTEFTKSMSLEEFIKKYAYNIRHNYGQEGKRVDYVPKSCNKIIMGTAPGVGEYHGCPYKHFDEAHLSALLTQLHIQPTDRKNILDKARTHHYGVACQLHFEATHPGYLSMPEMRTDGVGNHPNGWYQASVQYYRLRNGGASAQASGFKASTAGEEAKTEEVPMEGAIGAADDEL